MDKYKKILEQWELLKKESSEMESKHQEYLDQMKEMSKRQDACLKTVKHGSYRLNQLGLDLASLDVAKEDVISLERDDENVASIEAMRKEMVEFEVKLTEMKGELPVQNNGVYLSIILGSNLNLSLLNKNDRYEYKQLYEKFKLTVTNTLLTLLFFALFFRARVFDSLINFVFVWYYCTLTIREAILSINGSRIKGWWMLHHYVSCVLAGVTLTWKDCECYQSFRTQLLVFCLYICLVQIFQSSYQRGCLRRLHSLGQRYSMDITVEGFSSWMFRGLTFLIPFLVLAYLFQLYNAYVLLTLHRTFDCSGQWQVQVLGIMYLIVGLCNSLTLLRVIINKRRQSGEYSTVVSMQTKYRFAKQE